MKTGDPEIDDLVEKVREISKTVYSILGPGYDESVYRLAMSIELREAKIPFKQEESTDVLYKGHWVGRKEIDLLVNDRLAVEFKSVGSASDVNKAQAIAQSNAAEKPGMLINFRNVYGNGAMTLEFCGDGVEVWLKDE